MRIHLRNVKIGLAVSALVVAVAVTGCENRPATERAAFKPEVLPIPPQLASYEPMPDYPDSPEMVALGRQLFFDKRLSGDGTRSCYSCHVCEKGLTDGLAKAVGAYDKQLPRSSPTLWNIGYHKEFYWDGRSPSLEKQAMAAWQGGNMGAKDKEAEIVGRINALKGYRDQFQKVFGGEATPENIMQAIAAYERTIITADTPWDKWKAGDESALQGQIKRGWEVFQQAKCDNCHSGVLFTDQQYHNVGVGMDKPEAEQDKGRFNATKKPEDTGAFKTPTLRDVARSAPYFHDGSAATLEEAVDFMLGGGRDNPYLDRRNLQKQTITKEQREDLLAFLRSLNVNNCQVKEPPLPQE
ncbi:MAG TPA: cytochrome c peroxidase [Blastocatellia bacterium]|nr:cytochrome c peroxidase [Blastocatellia bacterium]